MRQGLRAITSGLGTAIVVSGLSVACQGPKAVVATETAPRTAWGEPDLQGIWNAGTLTPLERPAKFAGKAVMTEEEAAELLKAQNYGKEEDQPRTKNDETDVAGAYNHSVFGDAKPARFTRNRTSLIVDPSDGKIPPATPEAQKRMSAMREYRDALLQGTSVGRHGPPSPRRAQLPPFYNEGQINRADGPEDRSATERCLGQSLPQFGGYRRIAQSTGDVAIFYDLFQGHGGERVIPVTTAPHLPENVRQWWGDPRGHWEGNTLVVDTTNFSPKSYFMESRENLHLVERFTRLDATTLEYTVTIEDPTVWTRPWTVKTELTKEDDQPNRLYYEPRCHEGNFGLIGILAGGRAAEKAFAEGKGPNPAKTNTTSARNCHQKEENKGVLAFVKQVCLESEDPNPQFR